ncbi:MAG TPA: metallophosphoesterase [Flavisolibacter sp.]|nr:metallophosphoesterase [Flavisolibacter sp.]
MDRRHFLRNSSLLTVGSSVLPSLENESENKKASLSIAFLTDVHIKPSDVAETGMRKAFRHVNALKNKPDFILNGGDSIMDALAVDKTKTEQQWNLWNRVLQEENKLPIHHIIGNHDVWGWQLKDESVKTDPLYDKAWAVQQHGLPNRYYSFEKKGWKFIILDSTQQNGGGYIARLDEAQFAWLETELRNTPFDQHICIASHIPIVSFCSAMFFDDHLDNGDWKLSRALLHVDARRLTKLFTGYKNIRCCLSGHIHLQDMVEYKNILYYCNGAISGNWWNGAFKGFDPAYALFQFGKDGAVDRQIVQYS